MVKEERAAGRPYEFHLLHSWSLKRKVDLPNGSQRRRKAGSIHVGPDGTVSIPEHPGLGIVLDEDKLAHYSEKFFEITSRGIAMKTIREKGIFTALRLARKRKQ